MPQLLIVLTLIPSCVALAVLVFMWAWASVTKEADGQPK